MNLFMKNFLNNSHSFSSSSRAGGLFIYLFAGIYYIPRPRLEDLSLNLERRRGGCTMKYQFQLSSSRCVNVNLFRVNSSPLLDIICLTSVFVIPIRGLLWSGTDSWENIIILYLPHLGAGGGERETWG